MGVCQCDGEGGQRGAKGTSGWSDGRVDGEAGRSEGEGAGAIAGSQLGHNFLVFVFVFAWGSDDPRTRKGVAGADDDGLFLWQNWDCETRPMLYRSSGGETQIQCTREQW